MNFEFNTRLEKPYNDGPQLIRVMSESWVAENIFCPRCGNPRISKLDNNQPVADFMCDGCGAIFELKSKKGNIGKKIVDGSYATMIKRITSTQNPDLFVLSYSRSFSVINMFVIPRFLFVPMIIEKRKPLGERAHRAGWTGCNILIRDIPEQGKIDIIRNQIVSDVDNVVQKYRHIEKLRIDNIENRGWLFDVLNCINKIPSDVFSLGDVYAYAEFLQQKHIANHNVEAKIRQQLQFLRDKGFVEFLGRGEYRKSVYAEIS